MPSRSGFLSQLFNGKPDFAERPADLADDFAASVLLASDPINESHRIYNRMPEQIPVDTPPHRMGFALPVYDDQPISGAEKKNRQLTAEKLSAARTAAVWGVSPDNAYFEKSGPDTDGSAYRNFSLARNGLGRLAKLADTALRLPAIIFTGLQISFERIGWQAQTMYKTIDNPLGKAAAFMLVSPVGLALNLVGAIPLRGMAFVSKVAAEAMRAPLAIIGAGVGLIFGAGVAASRMEGLRPARNSLVMGMVDGIRPFAPEVANFLLMNYMLFRDGKPQSARLPFADMPKDSLSRSKVIDVPWLPVAMFVLALTAVLVLSAVTFGGAAAPFVPLLFTTAAHAAGFATTGLALAAFKIALIGGLTAAGVGMTRGVTALLNDTVSIVKSSYNAVTSAWNGFWEVRRVARDLQNNANSDRELDNLEKVANKEPVHVSTTPEPPIAKVEELHYIAPELHHLSHSASMVDLPERKSDAATSAGLARSKTSYDLTGLAELAGKQKSPSVEVERAMAARVAERARAASGASTSTDSSKSSPPPSPGRGMGGSRKE